MPMPGKFKKLQEAEKALKKLLSSAGLSSELEFSQFLELLNIVKKEFGDAVNQASTTTSDIQQLMAALKELMELTTKFVNDSPSVTVPKGLSKQNLHAMRVGLMSFFSLTPVTKKISSRPSLNDILVQIKNSLDTFLSQLESTNVSKLEKQTQTPAEDTLPKDDDSDTKDEDEAYHRIKNFLESCTYALDSESVEDIQHSLGDFLQLALSADQSAAQEEVLRKLLFEFNGDDDIYTRLLCLCDILNAKIVEEDITLEQALSLHSLMFQLSQNRSILHYNNNSDSRINMESLQAKLIEVHRAITGSSAYRIQEQNSIEQSRGKESKLSSEVKRATESLSAVSGDSSKNTPGVASLSLRASLELYQSRAAKSQLLSMNELCAIISKFHNAHDNYQNKLARDWDFIINDIQEEDSAIMAILSELTKRIHEIKSTVELARLCHALSGSTLLYTPLQQAIENRLLAMVNLNELIHRVTAAETHVQVRRKNVSKGASKGDETQLPNQFPELWEVAHFCHFFMDMGCETIPVLRALFLLAQNSMHDILKLNANDPHLQSNAAHVGRIAFSLGILSKHINPPALVQNLHFTIMKYSEKMANNIPDNIFGAYISGIRVLAVLTKDIIDPAEWKRYKGILAQCADRPMNEKYWTKHEGMSQFADKIKQIVKEKYKLTKETEHGRKLTGVSDNCLRIEHLIDPFHYDFLLITPSCIYAIEANGKAFHYLVLIDAEGNICFDHLNGKSRFKKDWIDGQFLIMDQKLHAGQFLVEDESLGRPLVSININQQAFENPSQFLKDDKQSTGKSKALSTLQREYLLELMAEAKAHVLEGTALVEAGQGNCLTVCDCERTAEILELERQAIEAEAELQRQKAAEEKARQEAIEKLKREQEERARLELERKQREQQAEQARLEYERKQQEEAARLQAEQLRQQQQEEAQARIEYERQMEMFRAFEENRMREERRKLEEMIEQRHQEEVLEQQHHEQMRAQQHAMHVAIEQKRTMEHQRQTAQMAAQQQFAAPSTRAAGKPGFYAPPASFHHYGQHSQMSGQQQQMPVQQQQMSGQQQQRVAQTAYTHPYAQQHFQGPMSSGYPQGGYPQNGIAGYNFVPAPYFSGHSHPGFQGNGFHPQHPMRTNMPGPWIPAQSAGVSAQNAQSHPDLLYSVRPQAIQGPVRAFPVSSSHPMPHLMPHPTAHPMHHSGPYPSAVHQPMPHPGQYHPAYELASAPMQQPSHPQPQAVHSASQSTMQCAMSETEQNVQARTFMSAPLPTSAYPTDPSGFSAEEESEENDFPDTVDAPDVAPMHRRKISEPLPSAMSRSYAYPKKESLQRAESDGRLPALSPVRHSSYPSADSLKTSSVPVTEPLTRVSSDPLRQNTNFVIIQPIIQQTNHHQHNYIGVMSALTVPGTAPESAVRKDTAKQTPSSNASTTQSFLPLFSSHTSSSPQNKHISVIAQAFGLSAITPITQNVSGTRTGQQSQTQQGLKQEDDTQGFKND